MKRILLVSLAIIGSVVSSRAQPVSVNELFTLLDARQYTIDTLMKSKGYRILEKENDSNSRLQYYTNLERTPAGNWVRSVSITNIETDHLQSRIVLYRTYRKKEYADIAAWLLYNGFQTTGRVNFGDSQQATFSDGKRKLVVKQTRQKLPSGVPVMSYEIELSK